MEDESEWAGPLRHSTSNAAILELQRSLDGLLAQTAFLEAGNRRQEVLVRIGLAALEFEVLEIAEGSCAARVVRLLDRILKAPSRAVRLIEQADPGTGSEAKAWLWEAAENLGVTIEPAGSSTKRIPIPPHEEWLTLDVTDRWVEALLKDSATFKRVASTALLNARNERSLPDWLRPFRDLAKYPTRERLVGILRRDREHRDQRYYTEAIRAAIAWLALFEGDVPPDWFNRVADDPDAMRRIAAKVRECFRSDRRGPPPDRTLQHYADTIADIYEELTGSKISYDKTNIDEHTAFGPELEFMCAALRLLDPGLDEQSAVAQIDRIRGWGTGKDGKHATSSTAGCDRSK